MKKLLVIVLALVCYSVQAQKWGFEFGSNYVYQNPVGGMGHNIQHGQGVTVNFGMVAPSKRFAYGIEVNLGQYGQDKSRQQYNMSDGTVAPMDIVVSNNFGGVMGYSRWYMNTEGSFRPYLVGKLGYQGFTTELNIYDPNEWDQCTPIENDVLYEDGTVVGTVGAGVKVDMKLIFKKLPAGLLNFDGSVNFTQGGQISYMSTYGDAHHHSGSNPEDVTAKFINTETQVIHEHHVGYLYTNALQMTEIRLGISMNISRR